jgi:hypothetical protein
MIETTTFYLKEQSMRLVSIIIVCIFALPAVGCGDVELQSQQKDSEIIIDGSPGDWNGALEMVKDAGVSFGLINDHKHLYIAFVIVDQSKQRQIMMSGLKLWFDETAEKQKHFAVNFPIGMLENGYDMKETMQERNPSGMRENFLAGTSEFQIASTQGSWQLATAGSLEEIAVAAGFEGSAMVLEFKMPLAQSGPYGYGIGARAGSTISLGVESPQMEMGQMKKDMGGGPGGMRGGRGGGPGGMGGGRGGMGGPGGTGGPRGQRPERPEPIKIWAKVILSEDAM